MARKRKPEPGRLIISIIYSHIDAVADALTLLEKHFGRIQCETIDIPYTSIDKYTEEMGDELMRRFFAFEKPVERESLINIKATCSKIERQLGDRVHDYTFRTVNIDPGIMTPDNIVIGSYREYNHRIYLGEGVFGEMPLIWARGQFTRLPWTSPDYYHEEAIDFFHRVRESFAVVQEQSPDYISTK